MCLLNYTKKIKKYKHIIQAERNMIERWIPKGVSIDEISKIFISKIE
jgi:IS30 family transposase